ncbi:MAG: LacI family DNA-binding transcriptional regulator [Deinococcales bacterium]
MSGANHLKKSIKDVARLAGVSSATVSRVLANKPHVREEVKKRVLEAVKTLEYKPSRIAQRLRTQRSQIIGLIVSDVQNSFFTSIARAVEDVAYQHGYAVFLCNSDEDSEKEQLYVDLLLAEEVAGIVISPTREQGSASAIIEAGVPLVTLDRYVKDVDTDRVLSDNIESSKALVQELIQQGHRRIAAVLSDLSITTGRERYEGYTSALAEAGLTVDKKLVFTGKPIEEVGYELAKNLLKTSPMPTAIFSGTRYMSLGVIRAIYEAGLRIPQNVSLASFDKLDWSPGMPEMLYAEQPTYMIGQSAARLLLERIKTPDRPVQHLTLRSKLNFQRKQLT